MSYEDHNMGDFWGEPVLIVAEDTVVRLPDGQLIMGTEAWNALVPPPGLEPGPRERADFESAASTNSAKGAKDKGLYHGLRYSRKNHEHSTGGEDSMTSSYDTPKQYRIGCGQHMVVRSAEMGRLGEHISMSSRLAAIMEDIELRNGWQVNAFYDDRGHYYLQIEAEDGVCNVSGKPVTWKGRKWLLSPHMTDSEIVQTALKAVLTAAEHEIREQFAFRGKAIFDPHYDLLGLVRLRDSENALQERSDGATVVDNDHHAEGPSGARNVTECGSGAPGTVLPRKPIRPLSETNPDYAGSYRDSQGYCDNPARGY